MLRIIIADDEFDIVELCRALITYPGAEIVGEACNGIELLKKIEELHPDVVITDICMPGMTGLELIERAKQEFPAINFIVMSGYTEFQYAQTALRFGVSGIPGMIHSDTIYLWITCSSRSRKPN